RDRDAELLEGLEQLRVHLVERLVLLLLLRRGVVADRLVVDRRILHVRPGRLLQREPVAIRLQPVLEHEVRLALLCRDHADDVFAQARRHRLGVDVGDEAVLVRLEDLCFDRGAHACSLACPKLIAYSQELQPRTMWASRWTSAPSTSFRKRSSTAQISGKRSTTARIAQLCSDRWKIPASSRHSAM